MATDPFVRKLQGMKLQRCKVFFNLKNIVANSDIRPITGR
ncbi:hypothetical protein BRO54_3762 [Geobacillus proteiniphilus]|uniref:Uncharacterized protein n=1 Tax=Geobacillus proteiniphilus TaxID=860353 RepID=A0A1Q5SIY7_9BACL|nr:hypothetical protein BRO54_3762 [Geobacillus proteiniphilus]